MIEENKYELHRLDSNGTSNLTSGMGLDPTEHSEYNERDSNINGDYVTAGGPDEKASYMFNEDAFDEDYDLLSEGIDDPEIANMQKQIEDLHNDVSDSKFTLLQINTLENERDEYKRKYTKENSENKDLKCQLEDSKINCFHYFRHASNR